MLLACVLVGEYLSGKTKNLCWKQIGMGIVELIADESDTCQQMYRIEYSAFVKLCTILSPQVQVNDEISGHKNSMGSITMR